MADEGAAGPEPSSLAATRMCPWCSVELGSATPARCPSCSAVLIEDPEASVPGVTTVDPEAVARAATWERVRRRSSFRGFLEGDRDEATESGVRPSSLAALDPPSAELRLEMGRLRAELNAAAEAEAQELEALAAQAEEGEVAGAAQGAATATDGPVAGAEAGSH